MHNDIETTDLRLDRMRSAIAAGFHSDVRTKRNSDFSKQAACTCFHTLESNERFTHI